MCSNIKDVILLAFTSFNWHQLFHDMLVFLCWSIAMWCIIIGMLTSAALVFIVAQLVFLGDGHAVIVDLLQYGGYFCTS